MILPRHTPLPDEIENRKTEREYEHEAREEFEKVTIEGVGHM